MTETKEKFASQADRDVLATLRAIARDEGRQFQAVLDEALRDYVDAKQGQKPRRKVLEALENSIDEFDELYQKLAK